MGKTKELRRQLKKEKVIDGFESAGYTIIDWYIDPMKNSCTFVTVKNNVNNIEFLCTIPQNLHLSCNEGYYVFEEQEHSPDVDDAISMWNECQVDEMFLKIHNKIILKKGKGEYMVYSYSIDRPTEEDIDTLERYANEMSVLNDEMLKVEGGDQGVSIIVNNRNPFDILLDGGEFEKVQTKRIEEIQPCILVDYNGYTMGQGVPVIDFMTFFNRDDMKENINVIAKNVKTIYDFQNSYIEKLFSDAIVHLNKFTESLESSYKKYKEDIESSSKDFSTLQTLLEKNNGGVKMNDICARAHETLRTLLMHQIEKRDNIIGLLDQVRKTFGEI